MVRIGKIAATHGLQGNLVLVHSVGAAGWLKVGQPLFVEIRKDSRIPFFVAAEKSAGTDEYQVRFEDIDSVEAARALVGRPVYIDGEVLEKGNVDSPLRWIGFNLVDKTKGTIGAIEDVYQAGAQWLAKLTIEENEVLVPLVDAFILDVNTRNRFIRMDLPDGLLEL
jgi:16S rRNA processing protein RimM